MEAEWQPARLRIAHEIEKIKSGVDDYFSLEELNPVLRKVVRVRPADPGSWVRNGYRQEGCDSSSFYLIHPDDMCGLKQGLSYACEHEILTD